MEHALRAIIAGHQESWIDFTKTLRPLKSIFSIIEARTTASKRLNGIRSRSITSPIFWMAIT